MRYSIFILILPVIFVLKGCYACEGTYTNLYSYGNNVGVSLAVVDDTSYYLVTYYDSVEIFKSSNQGKYWAKQHSFDKRWIYWSSLLNDENLYIVMKNRTDTCHVISRFNLSKKTTTVLSLPDSLYWGSGSAFWFGNDRKYRLLLKSKTNKNLRGVYIVNAGFEEVLLERMLPDSCQSDCYVTVDSILVYKSKITNNVVISYPHKEEVLIALKNKRPWLYAEGKVYLTADTDSTDNNIYSFNLANQTIDTIPSYPLRKRIYYVGKDMLITTSSNENHKLIYGITKDNGITWRGINSNYVFPYCSTIYNGELLFFECGNFRSYKL